MCRGERCPTDTLFMQEYWACDVRWWRDWRMKHMDNRRGSPWLLPLWQVALQTDAKHWHAIQQASVKFKAPVPKGTVDAQLTLWHANNNIWRAVRKQSIADKILNAGKCKSYIISACICFVKTVPLSPGQWIIKQIFISLKHTPYFKCLTKVKLYNIQSATNSVTCCVTCRFILSV